METTQKQIVLGILAHVDSGKTTLSEAMLYRAGAIRKLGRVDHGDAFLDTDSLEKARGITIFSKQALLTAGNTAITLLDTPGHVDFSTETERTLPRPAFFPSAAHRTAPVLRCGRQALRQNPQNPRQGGGSAG